MTRKRKKKQATLDWESRYADNWDTRRRKAIALVKGKCCWCLIAACDEVHHAIYQDELGAIAGREIAGLHIFPVCKRCHDKLHSEEHWIKDQADPVLGNRNRARTLDGLRFGYQALKRG